MVDPVKRDYRSALRAAQADDTRRAIVNAAAELFTADGYGATTIDAIAGASGVSRKTVFSAVGGKVALLKTALDWAVAGDDRPVALSDRPAFQDLFALEDPRRLLRDWVRLQVQIAERAVGLFRALEVAAETDVEARELLTTLHRQRLEGAAQIVDRVAELGADRAAVPRDHAVDVAWLAADPVVFDRMVRQRGWATHAFEAWVADALIGQLLRG
ncbi:MAG: TetR/AcrR family transcriptional regulator [Mycolicibacterium sp.]|nr:TetR/AcrR family transcriptional regulator [Mycolicibacterium sp.]